jgi:RHS repeat-associated protein
MSSMGNNTMAKNLEATITELGFTDSLSWSSQSASAPDTNVAHYPRLMYYYHPDYLGHVEYITDLDGLPYQHFYYTAWGETLIEEKATRPGINFDSPYRFNGKELDEETGLYYYGARYYNPTVSVWLGVDPKSQWYPNKSPYNFSGNNPAMIIDPNGKWEQDVDGNWIAQKGDSWWSLHKDAGISWSDAKKIAGNFNQNRGVDNWKTVRVGDAVSTGSSKAMSNEVSFMPKSSMVRGINESPSNNQNIPNSDNQINWNKVAIGTASMVGGITSTIAGFGGICSVVGAGPGMLGVTFGVSTTGFGLANVVDGFMGSDQILPSGTFEAVDNGLGGDGTLGQSLDIVTAGIPRNVPTASAALFSIYNSNVFQSTFLDRPIIPLAEENLSPQDNTRVKNSR